MKKYSNIFQNIISIENLFSAWEQFKKEKRDRKDVMKFEFNLEKNLFQLHQELLSKAYVHGSYTSFYITDPKQRHIHKALVRDRIVHHAVFSVLLPIFEPTFIYDSYSCRKGKGTHKGVYRFEKMFWKISRNNHIKCYVLKCDIKKFFESIDHEILISLIQKKVKNSDAISLLKIIIDSFNPGLPIGNLTSQLFANIYLNELDRFIKHTLRIPFYVRYTDDFLIASTTPEELNDWLSKINYLLKQSLKLRLHPRKITLRKFSQGIDFLGYVQFPHHRILRTKTKKRIFRKLENGISEQSLQSYLGVLSHANSFKLSQKLKIKAAEAEDNKMQKFSSKN